MSDTVHAPTKNVAPTGSFAFVRSLVIGLIAFFTVVDLFATQAILPSLTAHYGVTPAAMGFAVNASTMGMAISALVVGLLSPRIERRIGIVASLVLLAIPTTSLAFAPDLTTFTLLRVAQGLCMSAAFALTLAYLGEQCSAIDAGGAFAAYITGNVASNLIGRLLSAAVADNFGLASNFYFFALLNLAGAILVYFTLHRAKPLQTDREATGTPFGALVSHIRNPELRAAFAIGFCILFAFIGTFTYVNFILIRPPLSLDRMQLGLTYLVFLPSIVTTLLAGAAIARSGFRIPAWSGLLLAGVGLPLLLLPALAAVLAGMTLVGIGTFFAQAVQTGFVGRAAENNRGVASGAYLASYFCGGLVGTAVLGQVFDRLGWFACVTGIGASLIVAAILATRLRPQTLQS